jgi:hypothetical protein
VDDHLVADLEGEYHRLQQAGSGVEAQAQLSVGRAVLVEGLDPQRPLAAWIASSDEMPCLSALR